MADTQTPARRSGSSSGSGSRRGVVQRFTAKVGPLPVWAWALLILVAGYLAYRAFGGSSGSSSTAGDSSSSSTPDSNTTPVSGDQSVPPASGQGGAADNLNDSILSQLSTLQGSVDSLTGLVQTTAAFEPGSGDAGSGSAVPNTGSSVPAAPAKATAPAAAPPRPAPAAPAKVRYYTYAPGKAPKNRKSDEAPAKGPAGTTLRFKKGSGYYYA